MTAAHATLADRFRRFGFADHFAVYLADHADEPFVQQLIREAEAVPRLEESGWFACPNAVFELGLPPIEGWVLIYLVRRAGQDGASFPSRRRIAADCTISLTTVKQTLRTLSQRGLLVIHRRRAASGGDTSNIYRLRFKKKRPQPTGRTNDGGGHHTPPGGAPHAPRSTSTKALKVDKDKRLVPVASPVDNSRTGTLQPIGHLISGKGQTDVRLLRKRFDDTPDAISPALHQIIAKWLEAISRASSNQRDRRTNEALLAIQEITGWTEEQTRTAMAQVAEHLSPQPAGSETP